MIPGGSMKALTVTSPAHGSLAAALHCLLNIPPLVNYLTSPLLDDDLIKKRVNAVGFTTSLAALGKGYWDRERDGRLDAAPAVQFFRKIHRNTYTPPALALRQMLQVIQESLAVADNFIADLGTLWLVHQPGCRHASVQQLVNNADVEGLPHLILIHLDRGERVRRDIDYGTLLKLVKVGPRHNMDDWIHKYELVTVMMEAEEEMQVFAKVDNKWNRLDIGENLVRPVADLNQIISTKAQVLAYLRCG